MSQLGPAPFVFVDEMPYCVIVRVPHIRWANARLNLRSLRSTGTEVHGSLSDSECYSPLM